MGLDLELLDGVDDADGRACPSRSRAWRRFWPRGWGCFPRSRACHDDSTTDNPAGPVQRERSPLDPELPFAMKPRLERAVADVQLQTFVNRAAHGKNIGRLASFQETFGERTEALRQHAGAIKQHTLDHLDHYLGQFVDRAEAAGISVHFAKDAAQAREITLEIARRESCRHAASRASRWSRRRSRLRSGP